MGMQDDAPLRPGCTSIRTFLRPSPVLHPTLPASGQACASCLGHASCFLPHGFSLLSGDFIFLEDGPGCFIFFLRSLRVLPGLPVPPDPPPSLCCHCLRL